MRPTISVCMASYNGAKYIKQQIESIICQLRHGDELIIVDDCSTDNTLDEINRIAWPGIRLHKNPKNIGHVKTFAKAIEASQNEIIFLSDQDDIWLENRLELMLVCMANYNSDLIVTRQLNFHDVPPALDLDQATFAQSCKQYPLVLSFLKLLIGESQLPIFGCAMAFKRELISVMLPFPEQVIAHDHWILICALAKSRCLFVEHPSVLRRVHTQNLSPTSRRSLQLVIKTRLIQILHCFVALKRALLSSKQHNLPVNSRK